MKYIQHYINGQSIAELNANGVVLSTAQQFLQMMMDASAEGIIVHQKNIDEQFFDLRSGLAGEVTNENDLYICAMNKRHSHSSYCQPQPSQQYREDELCMPE